MKNPINQLAIPDDLKLLPQWVMWRVETRNGRPTKVPYNACTGDRAASNDPSTWCPFVTAIYTLQRGGFDGIGFVFSSEDPFAGLDLDDCRDPETGEIADWAVRCLDVLDSYSEVSPSGTGVKVWVRADKPGGRSRKAPHYEMYDRERYFAVTGDRLGGYSPNIEARQRQYARIYHEIFPEAEAVAPAPRPAIPITLDDAALLDKARRAANGAKFEALWAGRFDEGRRSEADLALCSMLAFWTQGDAPRIDGLFRQSGLMRDKWDDVHRGDGRTYGEMTIEKSLSGKSEFYSPEVQMRRPLASAPSGAGGGDDAPDDGGDTQLDGGALRPLSAEGKPPSDLALAQEWAARVAGSMIYVEGDQWWSYRDGRWSYSSLEMAQRRVQEFLTDLRGVDPLVQVTRAKVQNVLFLAKSLLGPHALSDFDSRPLWIPLRNGVYDMDGGALLPHAPEWKITRQSPFDYDPDAACPTWEAFLREVLITTDGRTCQEWIDTIQEWFGYCLIPDATSQVSMFWVGEGGNGKGVAVRVLEQLVGKEFTTSVPIEQLHDPYHRADLFGKLVGFVNEPDPKSMVKNGNHFKAITGGDTITARRPTEKVFAFTPYARIVVSCNALPSTRDLSHGYFRRIVLIEWRYNVPDEKRDSGLEDRLRQEMPGILNWALAGLRRWRDRGGKLTASQQSADLLRDYRKAEDSFGRFFEECCEAQAGAVTGNSKLYARYVSYCKNYGEPPQSAIGIGRRLSKMGFANAPHRIGGALVRVWDGLQIREDTEDLN